MKTKFEDFLNESLRDKMQPKSDEEVESIYQKYKEGGEVHKYEEIIGKTLKSVKVNDTGENSTDDEIWFEFEDGETYRMYHQQDCCESVTINDIIKSNIGQGLLILVGIENSDTQEDINWLSGKIARLRIFNDKNGIMNLSVTEVNGEVLVVSQFTLHASTHKGNRPSYINAAKPHFAIPMYEKFILKLEEEIKKPVQTGEFGAMMEIGLVNDGPVTIIIDSKNRE